MFNIRNIRNALAGWCCSKICYQQPFIVTKKIHMFCDIIIFKNKPTTFTARAHRTQCVHDFVLIRWTYNYRQTFEIPLKIASTLGLPVRDFEDVFPHLTSTSIYLYLLVVIARYRSHTLLQKFHIFISHMANECITVILEFSDMTS